MRRTLAGLLLAALVPLPMGAIAGQDASTPPPVSGRRMSDPASILPADVLARVELLRTNVELLRQFMGQPPPPAALLRVEGAQPWEVYSQALNLQLRANLLAFEQVRVVRSETIPMRAVARPADVFDVVDAALAAVLLVKRDIGIETAVAEEIRPETTTPSEVFNATISAGSEINHLLRQRTSPSDVFQLMTAAVHSAAALHVTIPDGPNLPVEPVFEPNKMPADVYRRMQSCYELIREVAESFGLQTLSFEVTDNTAERVVPNDVSDLAALVVEELHHLHLNFPDAKTPGRSYYPGKRFPAHVYQRAGLLEKILRDLVQSRGAPVGATASN